MAFDTEFFKCLEEIPGVIKMELDLDLSGTRLDFENERCEEVIQDHKVANNKVWDVFIYDFGLRRKVIVGKISKSYHDSGEYAGANQRWESYDLYCFHPNYSLKKIAEIEKKVGGSKEDVCSSRK